MQKLKWLDAAQTYSFCLLAASIPLPFIIQSYATILVVIFWLFNSIAKKDFRLQANPWLLAWPALFILHAISYFYSVDKDHAAFNLSQKLSMLFFPLVFSITTKITRNQFEKILLSFLGAITFTALGCILYACYIFLETGSTTQFFYHNLVYFLDANAVYVAWYTIFSLTTLLFFPWQNKLAGNKGLKYLAVSIQLLFFVLLSSRTLLFVFILLVLPFYIRKYIVRQFSATKVTISVLALCAAVWLLFATQNPIKKRYADILEGQKANSEWKGPPGAPQQYNNLTLRIFLWKLAFENIKEHNLWAKGAGIGSVSALQNKKLDEHGVPDIYNEQNRSPLYNVNIHNMYIQILFMLGIPGLLIFLFIVFSPLVAIPKNSLGFSFLFFNVFAAIFMFQEATLETQAGVIYYIFLYCIIANFFYNITRNGPQDAHL